MSTEHHGIFCYSLNLLFLIKYLQTWHYIEQAVTVNTEFKKEKVGWYLNHYFHSTVRELLYD